MLIKNNATKLPYKRFFAFGCSYTDHVWPTWADIFAKDTKIEYKNLANGGSGNCAIQSSIVFADIEYKFDEHDLVMIMWSSWLREDRYLRNQGWAFAGNIFNNHFYDRKFIEKYWSLENDYIKNITAILNIQKSYKNFIKFQGSMCELGMSECNIDGDLITKDSQEFTSKIFQQFKLNTDRIIPFEFNSSPFENKSQDRHPDILSHLSYLECYVYPRLKIKLCDETREICTSYFNDAVEMLNTKMTWIEQQNIFFDLNKKYNFKQT